MNITLKGKKLLCRGDRVKDLEKGRLACVMQVAPKCDHMCPYKNEAEGDLTQTHRGEGDAITEAETGVKQP